MKLSAQAHKLVRQLFDDESQRAAFIQSLSAPRDYQPAILWTGDDDTARAEGAAPFGIEPPLPWQPAFVDRLSSGQRPGQHVLHEQGAFYCLDMSSVFAASVMSAAPPDQPLVIDVCASPGGKGIFAWRLLRPAMLVANEVIKKRTAQLIANLKRCRVRPAAVTALDSSELARRAAATASLVIVDAPCSGQSLIAKGRENPGCFHPATINLNANRQRRILANSAALVAPGGHLAYLTCTYSLKENEGNAAWFMKQFPDFSAVTVPHLQSFQSHLASFPCYRLWPQNGIGAGAFALLWKREGAGERKPLDMDGLRPVWTEG